MPLHKAVWFGCLVFFIAAACLISFSQVNESFAPPLRLTSVQVGSEAEIERVEDEKIRVEESKAGRECETKRIRHPGMVRSMKVQFVHIPKTGGSSIQIAMEDWVEGISRISVGMINTNSIQGSSFKCPVHANLRTLFIGHRGWGVCEEIESYPGGLFTITAIREPVSRMVSLYDYNLLKRDTERANKLFGSADTTTRYTLQELVKLYNSTEEIEPGEAIIRYSGSQQARFMCGYECLGPNAFKNATFTEEYMLNRALENLRKTDCVGVTDRLYALIDQLKLHLSWVPKRVTNWEKQNTLPSLLKSVLDDEARAIMLKWAWVDQRLYEEASKIANEKHVHAHKCLQKLGYA